MVRIRGKHAPTLDCAEADPVSFRDRRGWQTSGPGDREVRGQLRLVLGRNGLAATGEFYDRAYAYIRENY